jgi:hypothetical protein
MTWLASALALQSLDSEESGTVIGNGTSQANRNGFFVALCDGVNRRNG